MEKSKSILIIAALILGFGIALSGYFIGHALIKVRSSERFVTVKGLAEREVNANLAIWPVSFTETSNELGQLQQSIEHKTLLVIDFLKKSGFEDSEITLSSPRIEDTQANTYGGNTNNRYRYIGKGKLLLRTTKTKEVSQAMANLTELIGKGIVLGDGSYMPEVQYLFTGLNKIKPSMIEEATKNAREAAEKFATDSGSKVGKIRKANQGLFSISDRDYNSPHIKKIRVVTTIEYYLANQ